MMEMEDLSALDLHFILNSLQKSNLSIPLEKWMLQTDEENEEECGEIKRIASDIYDEFVFWKM